MVVGIGRLHRLCSGSIARNISAARLCTYNRYPGSSGFNSAAVFGLPTTCRLIHTSRLSKQQQVHNEKQHQPVQKKRHINPQEEYRRHYEHIRKKNLTGILYVSSFVIIFLGVSYAAVPLYRLLCKRTGFMGTPKTEPVVRDIESLRPLENHRKLRITFSGQVSTQLNWSFKPEQRQVTVVPGETALAFFKAYNKSDKPIVGVATYNVIPEQAAPYFNKIQCFCFDEQQLDPREEIDMPVFFFIDPEFAEDPLMDDIDTITLSYTFFKSAGRE